MKDLERTAFHYLLGHSFQFFADSFAGSLVRRVGRLSRGYADIMDAVLWRLLPLVTNRCWIPLRLDCVWVTHCYLLGGRDATIFMI
jgi:hypothetical protein